MTIEQGLPNGEALAQSLGEFIDKGGKFAAPREELPQLTPKQQTLAFDFLRGHFQKEPTQQFVDESERLRGAFRNWKINRELTFRSTNDSEGVDALKNMTIETLAVYARFQCEARNEQLRTAPEFSIGARRAETGLGYWLAVDEVATFALEPAA